MIEKDIQSRSLLVYSDSLSKVYKSSLLSSEHSHNQLLERILKLNRTHHFLNNQSTNHSNCYGITSELLESRKLIDKCCIKDSELYNILHTQINTYEYRFLKKIIESINGENFSLDEVAPSNYVISEEAFKNLSVHLFDFFPHFPDKSKETVLSLLQKGKADTREVSVKNYFSLLPKNLREDIDVCCAFVNRFCKYLPHKLKFSEQILNNPQFIKTSLNQRFSFIAETKEDFHNFQFIKKLLPLQSSAYNSTSIDDTLHSKSINIIEKNYERNDYLTHILLDAPSILFFKNIPSFKIDVPVITNAIFGFYEDAKVQNIVLHSLFRNFKTNKITFSDIETSEILEMLIETEAFNPGKAFYSASSFDLIKSINPKIHNLLDKLIDISIEEGKNTGKSTIIDTVQYIKEISSILCRDVLMEDLKQSETQNNTKKRTHKF